MNAGCVFLVLGVGPLHKFTAGTFDEIAADDTDHERLAELNKKYGMLSLVELVLMVAIVATMSGMRWGLLIPTVVHSEICTSGFTASITI